MAMIPQELVDYCIDFLHGSIPDLTACALVSRSWVHSAQFHIFSNLVLGTPGYTYGSTAPLATHRLRCSRLCELFAASPHFIRLIQRLDVFIDSIPPDSLAAIADVPFTHVKTISVAGNYIAPPIIPAIQQLLSLASLADIAISGNFRSADAFARVLARCSPHVVHVTFGNIRTPPGEPAASPPPHGAQRPKIALEAFDIWWSDTIHAWLDAQTIFDFSQLRRLALNDNVGLPRLPALAPAIAGIQHLQFHPRPVRTALASSEFIFIDIYSQNFDLQTMDLAPFVALTSLEILIDKAWDVPIALRALATLPAGAPIHAITVRCDADAPRCCGPFDVPLSALPNPLRVVHFVCSAKTTEGIEGYFPALGARGLLRVSVARS
jgi:hypothetical protein